MQPVPTSPPPRPRCSFPRCSYDPISKRCCCPRRIVGQCSGRPRMTQALPKFSRISSTPAYRLVADAIERDIVSGRLRPGEPLGTEAELVTQFAVNRSTVREGIRLLEHGGLDRRDSSPPPWVGLPHHQGLPTRMS